MSTYGRHIFKPNISFICLINENKNINIKQLRFFYEQFLKYTNIKNNEFFFITAEGNNHKIKEYLNCNRIQYYCTDDNPIISIYDFSSKKAKEDYLVFLNIALAFSHNWFENLRLRDNICVSSKVIETEFGHEIREFNEIGFNNYAERIAQDAVENGKLSFPLLIKKIDVPKLNSIVYKFHFENTNEDNISDRVLKNENVLIICNDYITGRNNEKVLWNYLIELSPNNYGVDMDNVRPSCRDLFESEASQYIREKYPDTAIVLQNASFMGNITTNAFKICYLQDNFRKMGYDLGQQETNLRNSDCIIANSLSIAESYADYNCEIVPIGVDEEVFRPLNKMEMKIKHQLAKYSKIGIFVGEFTEIKGWPLIRCLIKKHHEIYFIIVSKSLQDHHNTNNSRTYNKISHAMLAELLNCADFFILGSPIETLCLAAVEACLCNIPVIMHNTGIFYEFTDEEKQNVGIITDDFESALHEIYNRNFNPRETIIKKELTTKSVMNKWRQVLSRIQLNIDSQRLYKFY